MAFQVLDDLMLTQLAAAPVQCRCPLPRDTHCDVNRCNECWSCMEQLVTWANATLYTSRGFSINKKALRADIRWHPMIWSVLRRELMPLPAAPAAPAPAPSEMLSCSICLDGFVLGAALVCGHQFHPECVALASTVAHVSSAGPGSREGRLGVSPAGLRAAHACPSTGRPGAAAGP